MAKASIGKWRESASLIILSKLNKVPCKKYNYQALLFNRAQKSSFMPCSSVFPGGVSENVDQSSLWLEYFTEFGVRPEKLQELIITKEDRSSIYKRQHEDHIAKEISLRITAIRETFEEVGIMLCRDRHSLADTNGYGKFREDFDRSYWQNAVHNEPTKFLTMCKELNVLPDIWSLHEWATWLTPTTFKKRFLTAFFIVALAETPSLLTEKNEVESYAWKTPLDYLISHEKGENWLPPPQYYELSRLLNISDLDNLIEFARMRGKKGSTLMLPVQYKCNNGYISLYPGDDMYPDDPESAVDFTSIDVTIEEFRSKAKKLHRTEFFDNRKHIIQQNFPTPHGHLMPMNLIQTKL